MELLTYLNIVFIAASLVAIFNQARNILRETD